MNTEFLKELGLTDEVISSIMTRHQEDLDAEYEKGLKDNEAQLDALKLEQLIDAKIREVNAKNPDLIKKLIDADAITVENGEAIGLAEQIDIIKEENPFLFEDETPLPKFTARPKAADTLTKATFEKMSYMDRVKLYSKNPALYRKLKD